MSEKLNNDSELVVGRQSASDVGAVAIELAGGLHSPLKYTFTEIKQMWQQCADEGFDLNENIATKSDIDQITLGSEALYKNSSYGSTVGVID